MKPVRDPLRTWLVVSNQSRPNEARRFQFSICGITHGVITSPVRKDRRPSAARYDAEARRESALAGNAITRPKSSGNPSLDSPDGIFNDNRVSWINPSSLAAIKYAIRSRLPCQAMCTDGGAVDPHFEEYVQLGGL